MPFRRGDSCCLELLPLKGRNAYNVGSYPCHLYRHPWCTSVCHCHSSFKTALSSFISLSYPLSQFITELYSLFMCHAWPTLCFGPQFPFPWMWNSFHRQRLPEFCCPQKTFLDSPNWNLFFPFIYLDPVLNALSPLSLFLSLKHLYPPLPRLPWTL